MDTGVQTYKIGFLGYAPMDSPMIAEMRRYVEEVTDMDISVAGAEYGADIVFPPMKDGHLLPLQEMTDLVERIHKSENVGQYGFRLSLDGDSIKMSLEIH